ncbi:MAG: hypothetical protein V1814_00635 [Candidatus Moraniibacteriota bacterium]
MKNKIKLLFEKIDFYFSSFINNPKKRWLFFILLFIFSAAIVVTKRPDVITNPQFYAEDGTFWFSEAYNNGSLHALLVPKQGYFQTISRIGAAVSQFLDLKYAPLSLNLIAILIQILPVLFLLSSRFDKIIPRYSLRILIALAYLLLPHARETHANLTNAQWRLAILMMLIIVSENPKTRLWKFFDSTALLIAGLSGPFGILIAPLFIVYEYFSKKRRYLYLFIVLGTGLIQIISSLLTLKGQRSDVPLGANILSFFKILSGNVFIASLIGSDLFGSLRHAIFWENGILPASIGILGLFMLFFVFFKSSNEMRLFLLFAAAIFIASLLTPQVSAEKPSWDLMVKGAGGRYYLLPSLAWIISLGWLFFRKSNKSLWAISLISLLLLVFVGMPRDFTNEKFRDFKYQEQVTKFKTLAPGTSYEFKIYPKGWRMPLIKK